MKENEFLNKVCICIFCIVYVLLIRYQWICWRISLGNRYIQNLSWRKTLFFLMIGKKLEVCYCG